MGKSESSGDPSRPWQSYHTAYTNAKAGMEGVDKEKVQRVIYEMSKGSKYFENEERKEAFIQQKVENMRARCAKLTATELSYFQKVADKRIIELEATRDLTRIWLHVDMDAFYAAVETLSNPSLRGKPMAVGGMSMISTANYEARRFGVRAAMPGFIARKLCPELIFVPVDFKKYTYYSDLTRKVFQKYDPNFMAASLDEAYLDITDVCKDRGITSGEIGEELRKGVNEETGLTCSAGVAPNRLLAKVCSDINKPNGQFVLPNDRMAVMTFISSLPIRKIGGIGKVTEHILRDVLGISTCEEMLQKSGFLCALFSRSSADFFLSVGLGLGGTDTPQHKLRKSISNERTFSATNDEALLYQKLGLRMSQFNEDKDTYSSDPTQKTLSNFFKSGDATGRNMDDQTSFGSDISSDHFTAEPKVGLPTNNHQICHHDMKDQLENNGMPDANNGNCNGEMNKREGSLNDKSEAKDNAFETVKHTLKSYEAEASRVVKRDYFAIPGQLEGSSLDTLNKRTNPLDVEAASSSNHNEQYLWVDDYKCSLCGVELPPSFVEERQEHFDFHLAEKLQEEESGSDPRNLTPKQRFTQKDQMTSQSRRKKKLKSSPTDGKHMPIDMFFVKSNENF